MRTLIGLASHFATALIAWYHVGRRDLPWRPALCAPAGTLPDAYRVLLSEFMLQQTQVATVIVYFHRFLSRFPTVQLLAAADPQEVLQLWQGLGYYSRARNLHAAARMLVDRFDGQIPPDVDRLLELPGVGRYTAGAIASIAFGLRAPILDGNVQRVLCRVNAIRTDPRQKEMQKQLWHEAEQILPQTHLSEFNSALMELGALVCTPQNPQCLLCPVRTFCEAAEQGIAGQIPPAKKAIARPMEKRWVFCIERQGRWLIEQRPAVGRWASMWQFVTIPAAKKTPTDDAVLAACGLPVQGLKKLGAIAHDLTHRRYQFDAWRCSAHQGLSMSPGRVWVRLDALGTYPMSKPQLCIARLLAAKGQGR